MRLRRTAALLTALSLPLLGGSALMSPAASASAHPASIHTAGKCRTSKNKPICSAIGPATKPTAAWIRVTASGDQRVLVQWSDSCALGTDQAGATSSGIVMQTLFGLTR
jgi:hypothetical protein